MGHVVFVISAILAVCAASSIRDRRQVVGYGQCGQNNGPTADPSDCSFFLDCFNGQATRIACVAGLEFNPTLGYCDYPNNIPNPTCQRTTYNNNRNARCAGLPNNALVAHDSYCNAFMYCGNGYLLDGCSFCATGQYFDQASQRCIPIYNNVDTNVVCNGKRMIQPANQEVSRLDGSCWPSHPNIYQALIQKILQTGK